MIEAFHRWRAQRRERERVAQRTLATQHLWHAMSPEAVWNGAIENGSAELAALEAVAAGADVRSLRPNPQRDPLGEHRPLSWALDHGYWTVALVMLDAGADPDQHGTAMYPWHCWEATAPDRLIPVPVTLPAVARAVLSVGEQMNRHNGQLDPAAWAVLDRLRAMGGDFLWSAAGVPLLHQLAQRCEHLRDWPEGWLTTLGAPLTDRLGRNALHWTLMMTHTLNPPVLELLAAGANPVQEDASGQIPLILLAQGVLFSPSKWPRSLLGDVINDHPDLQWETVNRQGVSAMMILDKVPVDAPQGAMVIQVRAQVIAREQAALREILETVLDEDAPVRTPGPVRRRSRL